MSWLHTLWFSYRTLSRTEPCPAAWWNLWWDTFTTTLGRCIATTWNCWKHSCRSGRTEWKYLTSNLGIDTELIVLSFLFHSVDQNNFEYFIYACSIIVNLKCVTDMEISLEFIATLYFFFSYTALCISTWNSLMRQRKRVVWESSWWVWSFLLSSLLMPRRHLLIRKSKSYIGQVLQWMLQDLTWQGKYR